MGIRMIILIAFTAYVLPTLSRADNAAELPSRKVSVVLPLLEKFPIKTSNPLGKFTKILGEPDSEVSNAGGLQCHYALDDKTDVGVEVMDRPGNELVAIWAEVPGKRLKIFYKRPLK